MGICPLWFAAFWAATASATLILPKTPPRGFNSFDVQVYAGTGKGPGWNESVYRQTAMAMVSQGLLAKGYDTIVIDGGWSTGDMDEWGRSIPNEVNWPSSAGGKGFGPLAKWTHSLGLKMGVWHIRGAPATAVQKKLPVKGTKTTIDRLAWDPEHCAPKNKQWCQCTWDKGYFGIDASLPESQIYYNSLVDLYAEWELDFLKWDCLYDILAGYSDEETLVVNAVKQSSRALSLSLSPGGGMRGADCEWIASGQRASMYRITNDFHANSPPQGLAEHAFVAANFSKYVGSNNTWPDLDMMDLGSDSPFHGTPTAKLHAAIWMMMRSPLMFAGKLPADPQTLNLVANPLALDINSHAGPLQVSYQGDCSCTPDPQQSQFACRPINAVGAEPCVAVWWAAMPLSTCRALAVLNIGNTTAERVRVQLAQLQLPSQLKGSLNVTNIYDQTSKAVSSSGSIEMRVAGQGAELLLVSAGPAEECATPSSHA